MGGNVTLMAAGYAPALEEPTNEQQPRGNKTNRQPQHKNLSKTSYRPLKLPPGHESSQRWGSSRDDDESWQTGGAHRPPEQPVQPAAPEAPNRPVRVMHLKNTFLARQVAPMRIPLAL